MVSKLSCFFLFGIMAVTNGWVDIYKLKSQSLLEKLSGLKAKYGLNFANIEGVSSLPKKYKEKHPNWHILENNDPKAQGNPTNIFGMLTEQIKRKQVLRTCNEDNDETNERITSESLRMCRTEPKNIKCKKYCSPFQNPSFLPPTGRSGDENRQDNADDTVNLLDDLENLLARNGLYNIFLGCGSRSHRGGFGKDRDNTDGREYLGCFGDGCRTNRDDDDDDDTGVRRL